MIVIGGSAGGVAALQSLLQGIPPSIPATIFVVLHRAHEIVKDDDLLPQVLTQRSRLPAHTATDGQAIERGHVYVAPRDAHMVVERGFIRVEKSPRESRASARPSVDVLFRSAALAYGRRVIGIMLTGMLDDGMAGLWQIRKCGGITMVQDPAEAPFPSMPESALREVPIDFCLSLEMIRQTLMDTVTRQDFETTIDTLRKPRVLIVEDERIIALNLQDRLLEFGYDVVGSAANGADALRQANALFPDVVLMDVRLEGPMSGTEAARLCWLQYQIPVVFLTSHADAKTMLEANSPASYGFVLKPFRPEQVHAAVRTALDRFAREMHFG